MAPAQVSVPASFAPPLQAPSAPADVYALASSAHSVNVLWKAPESDGGAGVSKYTIEWDVQPSFDSNNGGPGGVYHKTVTVNTCTGTHCSYVVSGLEKGTPYYVRVFAFNTYGFSALAGVPPTLFVTPVTQPAAPAGVTLQSAEVNGLPVIQATIAPPTDDGGAPVTSYRVEWDVLGAEAHPSVNTPAQSLLYSPYDVQAITLSAAAYDTTGYFYVAFGGVSGERVGVGATAAEVKTVLELIPTVGEVLVTRVELPAVFGCQWRVTFLNSEWWSGGKFFDLPLLQLANTDYTPVSAYVTDTTGAAGGTYAGSGATVTATRLVGAYAGYEQQSVVLSTTNSGSLTGTYSLSTGPYATPPLAVNASDAAIAGE